MDDNKKSIDYLRTILDRLDADLIQTLEDRRNVSRELGTLKGHACIINMVEFVRRRDNYQEKLGQLGKRVYLLIHDDSVELQKR